MAPENTFYYSRALDLLEQMAFDFISEKEGEKYFKAGSIFRKSKFLIKKGYAMVRKQNSFSTKITIFNKDPNGYFFNGELHKVIQFSTVRVNTENQDEYYEEEECEEKAKKRRVISEMIKKTVKIIDPTEASPNKGDENLQCYQN